MKDQLFDDTFQIKSVYIGFEYQEIKSLDQPLMKHYMEIHDSPKTRTGSSYSYEINVISFV